jgi:hypothetical protein
MKSIEASDLGEQASNLISSLGDEPILLTKEGEKLALVVSLRGIDVESLALSSSPAFLEILERSRKSLRKEAAISLEDMKALTAE